MDLLAGHRFTVASFGPAAGYAGWLLRQYGADVAHTTALDAEGLGAFLGQGARFIAQPALASLEGVTLVTDAPVNAGHRAMLETLGRDRRVIWITPWGLDNAWSEAPATGLVTMAAGGWMSAVGDPGRPPLGPPGEQSYFIAGLFACVDALAMDQAPGLSIVSIVEAVAATCIYDPVAFQYHGVLRERVGHRFSKAQCTQVNLPTVDGYIGVHAALHPQWLKLCAFMGRPELASDERFATIVARMRHLPELDEILREWSSGHGRFPLARALQAARIPASPLPTIAEVLDSPHLEERGAWDAVETPAGRRYRVPGAPARVVAEAPAGRRRDEDGPWERGRLRVVDLSMGWAGPLVSHILSCYGADVIKVESHRRFDWWRGSRPAGDDPTGVLHERSPAFNTANRGKRGLTLDLTRAEGLALARELIATADVVVENFTVGVLERLGLSYDSLAAENPELIMVRQPGFGSTGPEAHYVSFGSTIEAASGLTSLVGYRGGGHPFQMSNATGDPVSGINGAVAALAAVAGRGRDGRGRCIEASQLEGFLPLMGAEIVAHQRTGELPRAAGNRRPGATPSGVYQTAGEDRWLAIECLDDAAWQQLAALLGEDAAQQRWLVEAGRMGDADAIDDVVSTWTMAREREVAVAELLGAGVASAPVNNEADLLTCEPFATSGFFEGSERAHVGYHLYPSLPILHGTARLQPPSPAPTLGQHNDAILSALGADAETIASLRTAAVVGEFPG